MEVALKVEMIKTITCNFCSSICRKFPFQSLTPTENAEDIKTYVDAMDFAYSLKNKDVRNIAITGQYGAGKSSFLRTYFKAFLQPHNSSTVGTYTAWLTYI
jgi:predicted NACHT family NTPase